MRNLKLVIIISLFTLSLSGCSRLPFLSRSSTLAPQPKKEDITVVLDPAVTLGEENTLEIKVPISEAPPESNQTIVPLNLSKVTVKPLSVMVTNQTQAVLTGVKARIPSLPPFVFLYSAETKVLTDLSSPQETVIGLADINPSETTSFKLGIYTFIPGMADLVIRVTADSGLSGESVNLKLTGVQ